jgi:hypothetical protein
MLDSAGLEDDEPDLCDGLNGWGDGAAAASDPEPPTGYPARSLDERGRVRDRAHGGQPTLYTVPNVLAILAALFDGVTRAEASRRAGAGVSTFYLWLQIGRTAFRNGAIGLWRSPRMESAFCE